MAEEKYVTPEAAKALGLTIISCGLMEYPDNIIQNFLLCKKISKLDNLFDDTNEEPLPERIKDFLNRISYKVLDSKKFLDLFGPNEHFDVANSPYSKVWPELTNRNVKTVGHVLLPYPSTTEIRGAIEVPGEGLRVVHFGVAFPLLEVSEEDIERLSYECKSHSSLREIMDKVPLIDYTHTNLRKETLERLKRFQLITPIQKPS